jgi:hypothetical protein
MYTCVYDAMVDANVAIKHDYEIMYDLNGNKVEESERMFGLPTRYELTHPEYVLFVDETGKNTN